MDSNYQYRIDYNKKLYEQEMSEVTKAILANLYRDYLVTEEKRTSIIKEENEELRKREEEKRQGIKIKKGIVLMQASNEYN